MDIVKDAEAARRATMKEVSRLATLRDAELDAVRERWALPVADAKRSAGEADRAYEAAVSQAAIPHEWVGKTVFRMVTPDGYGWQRRPKIEERAIVEMQTPDTAAGRGSRLPGVGQPIVRLLLKSGKPGAKCEPLKRFFGDGSEWSPVPAPRP